MATIETLAAAANILRPFTANPPPQYWLSSDATYSYCGECVWLAAWFELNRIGPPPRDVSWHLCREIHEEINDRIDGGSWCSGSSDSPQYCEMCDRLLQFRPTEYCVGYMIEGLEPKNITISRVKEPDVAYELYEMFDTASAMAIGDIPIQVFGAAEKILALLGPTPGKETDNDR